MEIWSSVQYRFQVGRGAGAEGPRRGPVAGGG